VGSNLENTSDQEGSIKLFYFETESEADAEA
jgi:hypothetical protein